MGKHQRYILISALTAILIACAYSVNEYRDLQEGLANAWPFAIPIVALAGLLWLLPFKSAAKTKRETFEREAAAIEEDNAKSLAEGVERLMEQAQVLADRIYVACPAPPPADPLPGKTVPPKLAAALADARELLICRAKLHAFLVGYSFGMVRFRSSGPAKGTEAEVFDALFRLFREAAFTRTMLLVNAVEDALAKGASHMSETEYQRVHAGRKAQELLAKADQRRIQYEVDMRYDVLAAYFAEAFPKGLADEARRISIEVVKAHLDERRLSSQRSFHEAMAAHGVKLSN